MLRRPLVVEFGAVIPVWASAKYAVKGLHAALIALGCIILIVLAGVQTVRLEGFQIKLPFIGAVGPQGWKPYALELEAKSIRLASDLDKANAAHRETKRVYAEAQKLAQEKQQRYVESVIAKQQEISNASQARLVRDLAGVRDRAERLRDQIRRAGDQGPAGTVQLPQAAGTPSASDGTPDCQRFPAASLEEDLECRRIATEQAIQLDLLIDWVTKQVASTEE